MEGSAGTLDVLRDASSLGSPDEGPEGFIVVVDAVADSANQLLDASESAAAQVAEEALLY
jgi:hypothetical protein